MAQAVRLILEPQLTDPTLCSNLNATSFTHPTLGCVFECGAFRKSYALPQVSDHDSRKYVFLHITAMTVFSGTTLKDPTVVRVFGATTLRNPMFCAVFF